MLQLSQFKHFALATLLGTTALIGTVGHAFAQEPAGSLAVPPTTAAGPDAVTIPASVAGTQAIVVENSGALSVIVLPAGGAGSVVLPGTSAIVQSADPPLDNPTTAYSPMPGDVPWAMGPPTSTNVLSSDDPPLDNTPNTGLFSNTPWKG